VEVGEKVKQIMDFTITFIRLFFSIIYLVLPLLVFLACVIIGLGQIVSYIEKWKMFDGFYWSFITATTVGYGDIRPLKKRSRILSIFIAFIGLMLTGIIIAVTLQTAEMTLTKHITPDAIERMKEVIN